MEYDEDQGLGVRRSPAPLRAYFHFFKKFDLFFFSNIIYDTWKSLHDLLQTWSHSHFFL
jgi:hypothetical protein